MAYDDKYRSEICGTIDTPRRSGLRYRAGRTLGDVFETNGDFDGLNIAIEMKDMSDVEPILKAIAAPDQDLAEKLKAAEARADRAELALHFTRSCCTVYRQTMLKAAETDPELAERIRQIDAIFTYTESATGA